MTEFDKMMAGEWYNALDPALERRRQAARVVEHQHNSTHPDRRGAIGAGLRAIFAEVGEGACIEAPFHIAYGFNIRLGAGCYLNANCVILDSAPVTIGARCLLGPGVKICCPDHHRDPVQRSQGLEIARPVVLEPDVWLAAGVIVCGGVTIGAEAIVGAGSVVTRDVAPGAKVAGVPARAI
ncbi:sugar O-acetyltransferase [Pseudooceanicola algae]|uniref:Maltose O-acetyltransferase n=1 Tax=Pseudooceanicola algae TaxID=1537215 RepID=A0A418SJL2_9RHOB|nr:sugar O-acetyltransferase [Pseudooceanicola algae]QPM91925.1 Maltose O-acetyltransferase [Pseudooceanicola algae]